MVNIIKDQSMPMDEILQSAVIAMMPQGIQLVRTMSGGGYRVAGIGIIGGAMPPYLPYEVQVMIADADIVLVQKTVDSPDAYLVKGEI
jgi:hypothetical protein